MKTAFAAIVTCVLLAIVSLQMSHMGPCPPAPAVGYPPFRVRKAQRKEDPGRRTHEGTSLVLCVYR